MGRKIVIFALMTLLCVFAVYAEDKISYEWRWERTEGASNYRWQLNSQKEDNWNVVDASVRKVSTEIDPWKRNVFYLEASADGKTWGESVHGVRKADTSHSIKVEGSPWAKQWIIYRRTETGSQGSSYGFGGRIGYRFNFNKNMSLGVDVQGYGYKGFDNLEGYYWALRGLVKFDYVIGVGERFGILCSIGAGVEEDIAYGEYHPYPAVELELGLMYRINRSLAIEAAAECTGVMQIDGSGVHSYNVGLNPHIGAVITL